MLGFIAKPSCIFHLYQHKHSQCAVRFCTGIEISSHIELIQDPFPERAVGEKGLETSEVWSRASQLPFQSSPWCRIESDSKAFESLKSCISLSLFVPCRSILSQETAKMKRSRDVKSIKHCLHGTGGRRGSRGWRRSEREFCNAKVWWAFCKQRWRSGSAKFLQSRSMVD